MNPKLNQYPKVVVATLTWNQKTDVLECLESLVQLDYPNYEIVVIDNASIDGTFEAVREKYPQVAIVRHTENSGAAGGVNSELRYAIQAQADYLLIIANDGKTEPFTLRELMNVAEKDKTLGAVFPKVYYWGSDTKIWFAKGIRVENIDWRRGQFKGFIQNVEDDGSFDEECEASLYPQGFCLLRMEAAKKAGFLQPGYFIYFEDADWFMRLYKAGYKGRYTGKARAWHKPSASVGGRESPLFYYYRTRNRLYFFQEHASRVDFMLFLFYFFAERLSEIYRLYRSKQVPALKGMLWGVFDFFRKKQGPADLEKKISVSGRLIEFFKKKIPVFSPVVVSNTKNPLKIRVKVNWNIGDEIMISPVFQALKEKYPQTVLDAEVNYPALLEGNPYVDGVNQRESFSPDFVLDAHKEVRGVSRIDLLCKSLGVASIPLPKVYLTEEEIKAARKRWSLAPDDFAIAITTSARWFSRQWERKKWVELVEDLMRMYSAKVFVLGKDETPLPVGINAIGQTSLRETAALMKNCRLFVGSDSGPVHLALAVGTPAIGLFGPLNPDYLITPRAGFTPIFSSVECRGCWSDGRMKHPDHCPKVEPDCMSSIPVSRVLQSANELLKDRIYVPLGVQ